MDKPETELTPRAYQHEILNRACKENVIATLATGSGKTLIAALLIRWISSQPLLGAGKKIFFLVPKVALVEQQRNFVQSQTQLRIGGFSGAMNVDMWDRQKWNSEISKCDVLVMTPQIMLDLLRHAYFSLSAVSLLIIDEAHHVRGKHPYNQIMREHYDFCVPVSSKPKIFGLTASPVWNPRNPQLSLKTLEDALNAKIITVVENAEELHRHSHRAREDIVLYARVPFNHGLGEVTLWDDLVTLDRFDHFLGGDSEDLARRYNHARESLGFHAADYYIFDVVSARVASQLQTQVPAAFVVVGSSSKPIHPAIPSIKRTLDHHSERFTVPVPFDSTLLTPKVQALVNTLNKHRTDSLQAIVFVEQRHVASTLAWLLSRIPETHWLKTKFLIGHSGTDVEARGMAVAGQRRIVKEFREKTFNLLVASSVAEEGLDFQSLSLVVRFDAVLHIVSLAQSRGRARHEQSSFAVMFQEDDLGSIARYQALADSETWLRESYAKSSAMLRKEAERDNEEDSDDEIDDDPAHRYVTSKNALLTFASAIPLLNVLCSLFRVDVFTPSLSPKYKTRDGYGGFQSSVLLAAALPIPRNALYYQGPVCRSRREAKSGAAFNAVKALHSLGVFDDYLLPVQKTNPNSGEGRDADGRVAQDVSKLEGQMRVTAREPWGNLWDVESDVWIHPFIANDDIVAAIVTGKELDSRYPPSLGENGETIRLGQGVRLSFTSAEERYERLSLMDAFALQGTWWGITTKKIAEKSANIILVPIQRNFLLPDYKLMEAFLERPKEFWTSETHLLEGPILAMHRRMHRPLLFQRVRTDLSPLSEPIAFPGQKFDEHGFTTYLDYYRHRYRPRTDRKDGALSLYIDIPEDDTMLEFKEVKRARTNVKLVRSFEMKGNKGETLGEQGKDLIVIIPQTAVVRVHLPWEIFQAFRSFPTLIRHVRSHYRAQEAQKRLGLPPLDKLRLLESLTLTRTGFGFDYQRLETLGDSCLKVATSVHVFNKFPYHHEGQLSNLRENSVCNTYLLGRAMESKIYEYVSGEAVVGRRIWLPPLASNITYDKDGNSMAPALVPRKAMPDCIEALLGVAWLSGGMHSVLEAGTVLNLCFGGADPWPTRGYKLGPPLESPPGHQPIEAALGYKFNDPMLLSEALTHPSLSLSDTGSYNRLEFLGDALVELFVINYIFRKFPSAQPGRMSWMRATAVCNATLSAVAIKVASLDKSILHSSSLLPQAMEAARVQFENLPYSELICNTWRYDPPKVLADVTEAVMGAIFVDTSFDLDKTLAVVAHMMSGVVEVLFPEVPLHPVSELMMYMAKHGCVKGSFKKRKSTPDALKDDCMAVLIHGVEACPPVPAITPHVSKAFTSEKVLNALRSGEIDLKAVCTCEADSIAKEAAIRDKSANESPLPPVEDNNDSSTSESEDLNEEDFTKKLLVEVEKADVIEVLEEEPEYGESGGEVEDNPPLVLQGTADMEIESEE